jgi:HlyD family secretion protein
VIKVQRGSISASVTSNGKVEPVTPYVLRALFPTFVSKVIAKEGQHVKRGELLATLADEQIRADLARAREDRIHAQDDLRVAQAGGRPDMGAQMDAAIQRAQLERDRLQTCHDALLRLAATQAATKEEIAQNTVSLAQAQSDLVEAQKKKDEFVRRAQLDVEAASLRLTRATEEVKSLQDKLDSAQVRAPIEGTLYSLPVKLSDFLKVGDPIGEVADLHHIRVRAFIDEPDLGVLEPNQTVEITWDGLPSERWFGHTEAIPKEVVSRGARSVGEVLCPVQNDKLELLPNTNVNIWVHTQERTNVLVVPRGAVHIEGTHRYVFVVVDVPLRNYSRLQKKEVKIGIASPTSFEIVGGVADGETLALPTDVELRDGMRVNVASEE